MGKLTAVLVGTGSWAEEHAMAYQQCHGVELVGICGHANAERLGALAQKVGVTEYSLNLAELLGRLQPDMLDIACSPTYRLEGVREATRSAVRLINIEKPMAMTPEDAYEIERLCRQSGKLLVVNHQKKFLPAWRRAKEAIASGAIGDIEFVRGSCQGNLLEQGTHLVDMVLFFRDYQAVDWVMGQIDELEGLDKAGGSAPDCAVAMLSFADGVRAMIEFGSAGHVIPGENKWFSFAVDAYGTLGHIKLTLNRTLQITTYGDGRTAVEESSWTKHCRDALAAHLDAAAAYACNPSVGHISDLHRSMASFEVIMAIYASGCYGGKVSLPQRFDNSLIDKLMEMRRLVGERKGESPESS